MFYIIFNMVCVIALVAADQGIKLWATARLMPVESMPLIPHVVELRYVLNRGAAFSMLNGRQSLLILVTGVALLAVAYWLFFRCKGHRLQQAAFLLILAGGVGNLIDRVANGEVVDYINLLFMKFAVFNLADICVCVGVGLFILAIFLEESTKPDGKSKQDGSPAQEAHDAALPGKDVPKEKP